MGGGRGGRGGGAPASTSIYVCNLPPGTDETLLAQHFGTIGLLKKDKRSGRPKIWIYRDKVSNEPKGDATVTYEDPYAAAAAVEWFNNKEFHGSIIGVHIAEAKNKDAGGLAHAGSDGLTGDVGFGGDGGIENRGRGGGREELGGKPWQQEGDWACPNASCSNINFAFRGVCNRCGTSRPAGASVGGGGFGGGRGKGRRGGVEGIERGRDPGGPPGLFGPNDWTCPMCGNINWAKRTKCNICNTTKPGLNEGGAREGRAGGYKEFDEAEVEETKRRRREAEEDDGEMYDEFGNLKKKFRVKAKQGEAKATVGSGKAGWDTGDLGVLEWKGHAKERRDEDFDRDENSRFVEKAGDHDCNKRSHKGCPFDVGRNLEHECEPEYSWDQDHEWERERDHDRSYDHSRSHHHHPRSHHHHRGHDSYDDHSHDHRRGRVHSHDVYKERARSRERDRD